MDAWWGQEGWGDYSADRDDGTRRLRESLRRAFPAFQRFRLHVFTILAVGLW
jgi:hypothetical protein